MKVPLLDLKRQYQQIREEVMHVVQEVFESQQFILGPKVEELENKIAEYCGCRFAVGVSSGTDALLISLMTEGVGCGDLVITSPYTFFATAGAITRLGARPVFVDIDEETYNMDPGKLEYTMSSMTDEQRSRVKALMPIHLFGQCAEMDKIMKLAEWAEIPVIEDAAQAIGAEYHFEDTSIRKAGSMGKYGCFSFFPSKNLGAFGDGGMVTTNDEELYERLKIMRVHGSKPKYYHHVVGGNFRLDALQAAILAVKLKYLDAWTDRRRENAALYRKFFAESGLNDIVLPLEKEKRHIYNQFVIKVGVGRDDLRKHLQENDIGTEIYYPVPLHLQTCFQGLHEGFDDCRAASRAAETTLALPIYPELTPEQIRYVVEKMGEFFKIR